MDVDDSYKELGLTAESSDAEIKAAWRRLAARWHPDRNRNPQALKKIQRINRALEEIRKSRGNGVAGHDAAQQRAPESGPAASQAQEEHGTRPRPTLDHAVVLTLEEAVAGCARDIEGEVVDDCVECAGSGLQAHASPCQQCDGAGQVRRHLWFGWMMPSVADCSACAGQGVTRHPCGACQGAGKEAPRKYQCRVQFPPGVRAGDRVQAFARVEGQRHKLGLQVRVELRPHEFFQLQADGTVTCEIPVDGFAWVGNRWIQVPTPAGLRQMRLKRGHLVYRIRGQGFPSGVAGAAADCMVTVVPLFPDDFSHQQEALIDGLIAANSGTRSTAAGKRMSAWNQVVANWEAR